MQANVIDLCVNKSDLISILGVFNVDALRASLILPHRAVFFARSKNRVADMVLFHRI